MLHNKKVPDLPVMGRRRRPIWPWLLGAVALILAVVGIYSFSGDDSDKLMLMPEPIDNDSLGMQEWAEMSELTRQSLESDDATDELVPQDDSEKDPFLIRSKIHRNQTLFVALKNHGLDPGDIQQVIASMENVVDFKKTKPGDKYEVHIDVDKRILKFVYEISPEDISISERQGNTYVAQKLDVHKRVERILVKGEVSSSLYQTFIDYGEKGELASNFMRLFKYDIDFSTDSQRGDEFSILVDKVTLNGEFYRYDRVWAATYDSFARGKRLEAYYFDSPDPDFAGYYDGEGRALKRSFLKTPLVGCRVTSPFNLKRMHPILKRVRPHYGIDYGCPTGTPVMAFADGVVTFADWKGGNGNLLVIEHAHGYVSLYAHLYGFAVGIKKGAHVKQGQVVAKLGNTGISTGPHLHFAVKQNGKYIDPASIDTDHAFTLNGSKLQAFNASRNALRAALNGRPKSAEPAEVMVDAGTPETEVLAQ